MSYSIIKNSCTTVFILLCLNFLPGSVFGETKLDDMYSELIEHASRRHSVDPNLIRAVIWKESCFNKMAVGEAGEVGLMQIMTPAVAEWAKNYNVRMPTRRLLFDPSVNIEIGTWYLARALRRWSQYKYSEALALCEYNAGLRGMRDWVPSTLDGHIEIRRRITYRYVTNILERYVYYRALREPQRKVVYANSNFK